MTINIDGGGLNATQVALAANGKAKVKHSPSALKRARLAHDAIKKIARRRPVYGQSTGVGSNKSTNVTKAAAADHGLRLLRSHMAGGGTVVSPEVSRAMMVVRLNQLAAGGSGVNPKLLEFLADAINEGLVPPITKYGAIGTGDLTALSTLALCIMGERPWANGEAKPFKLKNTEALALISSSAATIGEAAIACHEIDLRLKAAIKVAAFSYLAMGGSPEAYSREVHDNRPFAGQNYVAGEMRKLLGKDLLVPGRRIQDSYGLRTFPQVHGPAVDAIGRLNEVLENLMNSASENPLVSAGADDIFHNGNFHTAYLTLALDNLRASLYGTASLSAARLGSLMNPAITGLKPFMAADDEGSSGVLITEYVAHSALAELRHLANPDSLGGTVLSNGTEEHAIFSTQSAWHTTESISPFETVFACELIASIRVLRDRSIGPSQPELREFYKSCSHALNTETKDRPLDDDISAAIECLRKI